MYYLVTLQSKGLLAKMEAGHIDAFKKGIEAALKKGSVKAAYSKVGGGLVLIVDSPSNAQLTVELRKSHITDAEVVPLVPLVDLLGAHLDYKATGKAAV